MECTTIYWLHRLQKAFDSIHHSALWKILKHYGSPHIIVDIISILYQNVEYVRGLYNETYKTERTAWYTEWALFSQIEYPDYADNIVLLSTIENQLQQKAQLPIENDRKIGLHVNQKNTKVMCMQLKNTHKLRLMRKNLRWLLTLHLGSNISVDNNVQAPNNKAYKWSCQDGYKLPYKLCRNLPPPAMGAQFTFFLASRPCRLFFYCSYD